MKKIKLIFIILGLIALFACEEEEKGPVIGVFTTPSISSPSGGLSYVLTEATEDDVMATFTWSAADFGFQAATTYVVMMDFADNNFAKPFNLGNTTDLELSVLVGDVNNKLMTAGALADVADDFEVRIRATIHKDVDTLYSTGVTLTITPFEKIIIYPSLYVPGSYQDNWNPAWIEWDAANENTKIYSVKDDGKYEGYLYFPEAVAEYKLLKVPAWEEDNTIGDPDASGQSGTLQIGSWGGNNIKYEGTPGYYLVKADLNALTYSHTLTDWGLIGSAVPPYDWSVDENMTYDPLTDLWTITIDLVAGDIKFRANDAWDLNYGDDGGDGKLEPGGANIAVGEAGNYTITLNLSEAIYRYTVVKN
ncbi:MAG: hypothetical protein AMS27_03255 [Bacteroides sp. SM23_62_1]|nr:MAG: hypothetical protein AMS27_03255 [Bacteroides sp. SM23_62_1]